MYMLTDRYMQYNIPLELQLYVTARVFMFSSNIPECLKFT